MTTLHQDPGFAAMDTFGALRQAPEVELNISPQSDTKQHSYFSQFPACTHMPQRLLMLSCCFVEER
jgi:hypothetical protein